MEFVTPWTIIYLLGVLLSVRPAYHLVGSICKLSSKGDMLPGCSLVVLIIVLWPLAVAVRIIWLLIRLYDLAEKSKTC